MLAKLSYWAGAILIVGAYAWGLSGSLQHAPNTPFPVIGFLKAITPLTLVLWGIGGCLIAFSMRLRSRAAAGSELAMEPDTPKRSRRAWIATIVLVVLFAIPTAQPLIWSDKTASPFGAFAEPVFLVGMAVEALCLIAFVLLWRRGPRRPH